MNTEEEKRNGTDSTLSVCELANDSYNWIGCSVAL